MNRRAMPVSAMAAPNHQPYFGTEMSSLKDGIKE